jgi:hypothetical protein
MGAKPPDPRPLIGDPPPRNKPVQADDRMRDLFTDQPTHSAGDGQRANRPRPEHDDPGENEENAMPVEEGFSPIP